MLTTNQLSTGINSWVLTVLGICSGSRYVFLLLATSFTGYSLCAQEKSPWAGFGVEANVLVGKVYKHEAKFTLPIPELSSGLDVNLVQHTYGRKAWEQRRHYPTIGIGFTYVNYGMDSVYGRCFSVYPNLSVPLIAGKRLEWTLRIGDGIGYVTRVYRRTAPVDTINVAIGNHLNDFVMLMTDIRFKFNSHWEVQAGYEINHISNGSYRKPNLGINMTGAHVGIRYFPVTSKPPRMAKELPRLKGRWLAQARVSMAMVSGYTAGGPIYPVYVASAYASRRWRGVNKFFGGIDYSYHQDIYSFLRYNDLDKGREANDSWKCALIAGNEFLFGRLGIVAQAGYYLKQAYIKKDAVYEKVGGQYYLVQREAGPVKELFISVFLKTHLSVAEFGEIGMGVGF